METKTSTHIVIGIPAFNADRTLETVLSEVKKQPVDVIVCDDGSTDNTAAIAERNGCKVVRHVRNRGYGAAIRSLFLTAREMGADVLLTIDGDGQHDVGEMDRILEPILKGDADVVTGSRFALGAAGKEIPRFRRMGIRAITKMTRGLGGQRITDAQCGFRGYNSKAIAMINPGEQGMGASTEILLMAKEQGLKVKEVPITVSYPRNQKTSTLNPAFHFADVVSSTVKVVSIRHPMLAFGLPGLAFLALSLAFGLWTLRVFSDQGHLSTDLTLLSIGSAVIGTILFVTGLLLFVLITVLRERHD